MLNHFCENVAFNIINSIFLLLDINNFNHKCYLFVNDRGSHCSVQ